MFRTCLGCLNNCQCFEISPVSVLGVLGILGIAGVSACLFPASGEYDNIVYLFVCVYTYTIHIYIYTYVYIYISISIYINGTPQKPMQTSILLVFTVNFIYFGTDFVPIKFEAPTVGKLKN